MDTYVDKLAAAPPYAKPVALWKTLVLFYPYTDTDYKTPDGQTQHFTGGLRQDQIERVVNTFSQYSDIISHLTGGFCQMQVDFQVIQRPVHFGGRAGFQNPDYPADCLPEKQHYADSTSYDSMIILYYPGPIPQDLRGGGGGGGGQTIMHVQYGNDNDWNPDDANRSLGTFVHEWLHGLDHYFMGRGYRGMSMHHIYQFPDISYNMNWHAAILQGKMLGLSETRYGYSRAAWASGSAAHPLSGLLPVQLLAPQPGVVVPAASSLHCQWNPAWVNSGTVGYRFRLYSAGKLGTPLLSYDTRHFDIQLQPSTLSAGNYVWTVQAFDARGNLSPVGESFTLVVKAPSEVPPIQFGELNTTLLPSTLDYDSPFPSVQVAVSSICGLRTVYAQITSPTGRIQRLPLHWLSPNENEAVWTGKLAVSGLVTSNIPVTCTLCLTAEDQAGRIASTPSRDVVIMPPSVKDLSQVLTKRAPVRVYLIDPSSPGEQGTIWQNHTFVKHNDLCLSHLPPMPPCGGPCPLMVAMDSGAWDDPTWVEVIGPDGSTDRAALEKWLRFNGMVYSQYLFPPNTTGHTLNWQLVFATQDKQGRVAKSTAFPAVQEAETDNTSSLSANTSSPAMRSNEIELQGSVISPFPGGFLLRVESVTEPSGMVTVLSPPHPKSVLYRGRVPSREVTVRIIGISKGQGKPMQSRIIMIENQKN